jgi:hypothetical protein
MSHVAARNADKKPGELVQVKVAEASTEAALLRMMGPRQEKERLAEGAGADASEQAPPPAAAAAQVPAGASPAKQSKNREATPTRPREGTPGAGTPTKSPRVRGGGAGGA